MNTFSRGAYGKRGVVTQAGWRRAWQNVGGTTITAYKARGRGANVVVGTTIQIA